MRPLPLANPPNPWARTEVEWLDGPPDAGLEIYEEQAKSIVAENDSPDIGFRYSVNPYRGCTHACAYCYARPSHQYWGFGAGTDFDRKIVVKTNAPELLRQTFEKRSWQGEPLMFSGDTDCYQPLEASYELTLRCLEVCVEYRNPAWLITKSALIRRDLGILATLANVAEVGVAISIPFADASMARAIEPYASAPDARFETIRRLSDAGIRVGVNVAPVIPGLSDDQIPEILERAREAGACRATLLALRLPREVLPVFEERLAAAFPARVGKVTRAIQELRGGAMNESEFGARMRGRGPRWAMIERLFSTTSKRLGLDSTEGPGETRRSFRRPSAQQSLFDTDEPHGRRR